MRIAGSAQDFTSRTGTPAEAASAATTCSDGKSEIVVNPAVLVASDAWLDSTLVHEAVHVATGSACLAAGESVGWAVEGLAEQVASSADAATAVRNRELVRSYLRGHRADQAELPSHLDTLTDYALAELAVSTVTEHLGPTASGFLERAGRRNGLSATEVAQVRSWFRTELAKLA